MEKAGVGSVEVEEVEKLLLVVEVAGSRGRRRV